jgi:hypothetical protein
MADNEQEQQDQEVRRLELQFEGKAAGTWFMPERVNDAPDIPDSAFEPEGDEDQEA